MSNNAYTQKSMEAIQAAQALAAERGHQQLEQVHLLAALMQEENGLIPQLCQRRGVRPDELKSACETLLQKLPQVRMTAREEGKVYVSADMDKALRQSTCSWVCLPLRIGI